MTKQTELIVALFQDGKYCAGKWRNAERLIWLNEYHGNSISEKAWNVLNIRPTCYCGKLTNWINYTVGYRKVCSMKCAQALLAPEKSIRHEKLWADPEWKAQTSYDMKSAHFNNRAQAKLDKLAVKGITPVDEIIPGMQNEYKWHHICGEVFSRPFTRVTGIWCPSCHVSRGQGELYEAVKALYTGRIIVNDRQAIKPKEIDIYLPDLKIGFEYHGEYWHPGDGSREADKLAYAAEQGIVIHEFWELLWKHKQKQELVRLKTILS